MVSIRASGPRRPRFESQHLQKNVDVAEVTQRSCYKESGEWVENVDITHVVLASTTKS